MNSPDHDQTPARTLLVRREGRIGRLVLNRPRQINSLTHEMVLGISAALDAWADDAEVAMVLITGSGDRGLCAGGDIREIYEDVRAGQAEALEFWRDEYVLNARIAGYPKPYVAVMDGITMGGGVGISGHGSVRIVTERSKVAMPETIIGFVPDVGGTYLLSRAPGHLGTHLALTGGPVGPADAILCGLADVFIPAERIERFIAAVVESAGSSGSSGSADPAQVAEQFAGTAPEGELAAHREWIDACYSADTVEQILERLDAVNNPAAKDAADRIRANSPTAVKVTLRAIRQARELSTLTEVLRQEYRSSCAGHGSVDLVEGVRAQIIDKDRHPRWSPPTLAEVTDADVERYFAPLGDRELFFGAR